MFTKGIIAIVIFRISQVYKAENKCEKGFGSLPCKELDRNS